MDYYDHDDDDEHDEDDLPEVSLSMSHYTRKISNNNDEQEDHQSNKTLENWRNLYETSMNSLQSDEDEQKSTIQKPFHLQTQISTEQPSSIKSISIVERPDSPIDESQTSESNLNKSKWEIRLPELLNSTVGPDRQKREVSRRHTTNIVFQQTQESNSPFSLENDTTPTQPINPLVKQLKQKFDLMTASNANLNESPKFNRVTSLTYRGSNGTASERIVQRSRPALPIRPTPEIITSKSRSGSIGSVNNRTTNTNNRHHRDKPGPPISYPKHYYPPPSTTSVVKQLIGVGGATLVYDSITQKGSSAIKPLIKNQRSINLTREDLRTTNSNLTGRQLPADYAKIKKNNHEPLKTQESESNENYYDCIQDRTSYNSTRSKSTEPWNRRRTSSTSEANNHYPIYDMDIKK